MGVLAPSAAVAGIYVGNPPQLSITIDRPAHDLGSADVLLTSVRLWGCGSGLIDVPVGEWVDLAEPLALAVPVGSWCRATVLWGSPIEIVGVGSTWALSVTDPASAGSLGSAVGFERSELLWGAYVGQGPSIAFSLLP
ncbi:MAG: hypothetical protein ABMB14_30185 [Myxococcota bacterium]